MNLNLSKKNVLPVIHVVDRKQCLENTKIAVESGCDGVFLISHSGDNDLVLECSKDVRKEFKDTWIGINLLGENIFKVFSKVDQSIKDGFAINGIWNDNARINEYTTEQKYAAKVWEVKNETFKDVLYFGSVAFKYQKIVHDYAKITEIAKNFMDVVTTSGEKTGSPPSSVKIDLMVESASPTPLAIASGISSNNVKNFPGCKIFMVASMISKDFYNLDGQKVSDLVKTVRNMEKNDICV